MTRQGRTILDVPEMMIPTDKFVVILGHNGSGKSTLMNLLARQAQADTGQLLLDGMALTELSNKELARRVGFLPQGLPNAAGLTVRELVALGRYPWRGAFGRLTKSDHQLIDQAVEQVDMTQYASQVVDDLSGGERQRVWIAMLLAQQSPIMLLDEPTSALDVAHQYELMALLKRLNHEQGRGMVAILHDINLASRYADHIIALKRGQCVYQGPPETFMNERLLADLYGISMHVAPHPNQDQKVAFVC